MRGSRASNGLLVLLSIIVILIPGFPTDSLAQSEYYFPQQQRAIEPGARTEYGIRTRFRTNDGTQRFFELIPSFTYSPGAFPKLQINTELPLVHGTINTSNPSSPNLDDTQTSIGDLLIRLRYPLAGEADWQLIGSFESTLATGENPFENAVGTGDGFDRFTPGLTFLHLKDPISSFFHVGYEFSQEETFNVPASLSNQPQTLRDLLRLILIGSGSGLSSGRNQINPGDAVRIRGGMSVLFNPTTRFNLFSSMSIRGEQEINGQDQTGTTRDDVRLGTGLDYDLSPTSTFSMNFVFGFSQSADDVTWVTGYSKKF